MNHQDKTNVREKKIRRFCGDQVIEMTDVLLSETYAVLSFNGQNLGPVNCIDAHLQELILGILYDRGYIRSKADVKEIRMETESITVTGTEPEKQGEASQDPGSRTREGEEAGEPKPRTDTRKLYAFPYQDVKKAYEEFAGASRLFLKTGGTHSGCLLDRDGKTLFLTEDMGRHNVMDKIIGYGLKHCISYNDKLLMISSRMPAELIRKCIRAGIVNVASVSAATAEAVDLARDNNMTLMGMYRNRRFNIYAWREENRG